MASELIDFGNRVSRIVDDSALRNIRFAAGMAGKTAILAAAASDLGPDRSFSGLRRKAPLGVGWDDAGSTMVRFDFKPAGLWKLAESGRRGGKRITVRKTSDPAAALSTPAGPFGAVTLGSWGGKGTYTSAVRTARVVVPKAAFKAFQLEVAKVVR